MFFQCLLSYTINTKNKRKKTLKKIVKNFNFVELIFPLSDKIIRKFEEIGYIYTTLDIKGFRSGSMNEILKN